MSDDDFLAFEYASGLLSTREKQTIEKTVAFEKSLKKWQLHLAQLNIHAPLDKASALKIWQAINHEISCEKPSIISTFCSFWRYILSGFSTLAILLSVLLLSQTSNAQLQWNINTDFSKQQLSITATTHRHINADKVCTLWVKKGSKIHRIGLMPETGVKILQITQVLGRMIKGGEMIISLEPKQNPALKPTKIEYQQQWQS